MVVTANVALPIVGLDNACQPSIQCYVGLSISGKHQQVGCIVPPANLVLFEKIKCKREKATLAMSLAKKQRPKDFRAQRAKQVVLRRAPVPVLGTQNWSFPVWGVLFS